MININQDKKLILLFDSKKKNINGKDDLPFGVASINKTEKIVVENGDKKKVTKIIKIMEDGSQQIETVKEILDE